MSKDEVARLRGALMPFAEVAEYLDAIGVDSDVRLWSPQGGTPTITARDCRNARAALEDKE